MKFLPQTLVIAALVAGVTALPNTAHAQDERVTINFTPAAATVGSDTELALSGSAAYRFAEHLWFEGDFTWIDSAAGGDRNRAFASGDAELATRVLNDLLPRTTSSRFGGFEVRGLPTLPIRPGFPIPIEGFGLSNEGQTIIATLGLRYEPSVQTARFRPYLSGGLGINHTEQELTLRIASTTAFDESISHSGFAFSAGGGGSLRLFSSVWANADAKYFRLSRDRNVIRFGGGLGVRF